MSKIITLKFSGILSRNEEFIVSMKAWNVVIKKKTTQNQGGLYKLQTQMNNY